MFFTKVAIQKVVIMLIVNRFNMDTNLRLFNVKRENKAWCDIQVNYVNKSFG